MAFDMPRPNAQAIETPSAQEEFTIEGEWPRQEKR
jgi:hypothetical protein